MAAAIGGTIAAGASIWAGSQAEEAIGQSGVAQADVQMLNLMYLANRELKSNELRDKSLNELAIRYGLEEGQPSGRQEFEEFRAGLPGELTKDPFFETLVGRGEEAVLRGASATGGLRSGETSVALAENTQDVLMGLYDKRMQEYLQERQREEAGLMGLAGFQPPPSPVSGAFEQLGETRGQTIRAQAEARQRTIENVMSSLGSSAGAYYEGGGYI